MALSKFTTSMDIIAMLDNEPNDIGGLTATQLKAKFDEGCKAIQGYINGTLTAELDSSFATKAELQGLVLGQIPDGSITEEKLADGSVTSAKLESALANTIGGAAQSDDLIDSAIALSPETISALGLSGNPQVKDALEKLSGAVHPLQYVWDKYSRSESIASSRIEKARETTMPSDTIPMYYSDAYEYNAENNTFTLISPTLAYVSYNNSGLFQVAFRDKYVVADMPAGTPAMLGLKADGKALFKCYSQNPLVVMYENPYYQIKLDSRRVTISQTYLGQVSSYNSNEYPADGTLGGYRYRFNGRPQYTGARIATGSYTGTGTFGNGNRNSLTFSFAPKALLVFGSTDTYSIILAMVNPATLAYAFLSNSTSGYPNSVFWGATVQWCSDTNAQQQFNMSGQTYRYIALA